MKPIVTSSKVEKAPSKPTKVYVESATYSHRLSKAIIEKK